MNDDVITIALRLFSLAREGDTAALAGYVDAGVPVNFTNPIGDTLLMVAAFNGRASTVRALLDRGADHARINEAGRTALAGAVAVGDVETVSALVDAGADPDLGTPSAYEVAESLEAAHLIAILDPQ